MNEVKFFKNEMTEMAQFLAQLVREGVTFKVIRLYGDDSGCFVVELTGGF